MKYKNKLTKEIDYLTKAYLRNVMQLAVFYTGCDELYAINISKIQSFLIKENTKIEKIPSSGGVIEGVVDIQGEIITVINFDKWLNKECKDVDYKVIIVCNYSNRKIAILVKDILNIVEKSSDELKIPTNYDPKVSYFTKINNKICVIFDAEKLLFDVSKKTDSKDTIYDISNIDIFKKIKSKKTILIAEDSKIASNKLSEFFNKIGIGYKIFPNGQELIDEMEKINNKQVGMIITDIEMPIKNGFGVIKFIKSNNAFKDIPIVALSSMTNMGVVDKIKKLGATKLINKSNLNELYEYIKQHLS